MAERRTRLRAGALQHLRVCGSESCDAAPAPACEGLAAKEGRADVVRVAALQRGNQARASALLRAANTLTCVSTCVEGDAAIRAGIGLANVLGHSHKRKLLRGKLEIRIPDKACSICTVRSFFTESCTRLPFLLVFVPGTPPFVYPQLYQTEGMLIT